MKLLAITTVSLLTLGLGGCMHMGHGAHSMHEGMEGHQAGTCPPEQSGDPATAHEHAEGEHPDECPTQSHPQ